MQEVARRKARLETCARQLAERMERCSGTAQARFATGMRMLDSLSPYRVLARGYCIPETKAGRSLRLAEQKPGGRLWLRGEGCRAECRIESIEDIQDENAKEL